MSVGDGRGHVPVGELGQKEKGIVKGKQKEATFEGESEICSDCRLCQYK